MVTKENLDRLMSNIWLFDIETLASCYLIGAKKLREEEWKWFEISAYRNDIDALAKWIKDGDVSLLSGFNNISFDMQVVQYIMDKYEGWYDYTNQEIVDKIYDCAQDIIHNQDYDNIKPLYKEEYMDIPQLDLGRVHNFFNETKKVSLKWIEFMTDQIVDEMPFHHSTKELTEQQCKEVREYCEHDIRATETLYMYTIGECENTLYKGRDKIQERLDAILEFNLPIKAISYSDVKLGEAVNLQGYMKEAGITHMGKLYEKKKNRKFREFTFGECIPKYVKLQSAEMQAMYQQVKGVRVNIMRKQEFPFMYKGLQYMVAKGGIHTENLPCILESTDEYDLIEFDASSQYPSSIVKRGLFPAHLGKEWLINYKRLIEKRLDAKKKGKTDVRYKGLAETLKVSVNGGGFGMTNSTFSVQYDPYVHFQCTIGNQFEILMLIEWMTDAGIDILSANTDGALCKVPKTLNSKFYELCKKWEDTVLITEAGIGELEYTIYKKYVMANVNHYLAVKDDGTLKQKGSFAVDHLLEKNKSKRIIPIAMEQFYVNGIPVEETIRKHDNVFDYCVAKKTSAKYRYTGVDRSTGQVTEYDKLIRYYAATKGTGEKMVKVKREGAEGNGRKQSVCEKESSSQVIFNTPVIKPINEYKIDYDMYITWTKVIMHKIDPEMKRSDKIAASNQIQLFRRKTSLWDTEIPPWKDCHQEKFPDYEVRTCTEEYYNNKFASTEGGEWKTIGSEHSITEEGHIKRRREEDETKWVLEINSLDELMKFIEEVGSDCVIGQGWVIPKLEIYDTYRE